MDRSSANKEDSARLAVGDLVLDSGRRTAEVEGSQLELTRTEFDLMWAMAAHPGRVYSRMQLLEIASGDSFDGYERTIDAHVKNLRRKIGDDPRAPKYIRTVFGVGYKIEIDR
jgi:DNA-binding response OmpR family regulator